MPYATNQNVRIHYQVEGEGLPLVLQHGFSNSLDTWYERGYVDLLKHDYRLILIDARGHGASDKPHDPEAYALQLRAGDIVAVLDQLHIAHAHFFGYSMGGWIGFGLAQYAPERFPALRTQHGASAAGLTEGPHAGEGSLCGRLRGAVWGFDAAAKSPRARQ